MTSPLSRRKWAMSFGSGTVLEMKNKLKKVITIIIIVMQTHSFGDIHTEYANTQFWGHSYSVSYVENILCKILVYMTTSKIQNTEYR